MRDALLNVILALVAFYLFCAVLPCLVILAEIAAVVVIGHMVWHEFIR